MSRWKLIKRSLLFYWRTNLGVLLATVVATAVLTGALVVGDSVRYSLERMVIARLGRTEFAVAAQKRFFRAELADDLISQLGLDVAPLLYVRGLTTNSDGSRRANKVEVVGVDKRFFKMGPGDNPSDADLSKGITLSRSLAERLDAGVADEVVLRIEKPGQMPRDVPLTPDDDLSTAFRLVVGKIADEDEFGGFSLQANHVAAMNVFVPISWLQDKLDLAAQANILLAAQNSGRDLTVEKANDALKQSWQLADAGLRLHRLKQREILQLDSRRIFIDDLLSEAALQAGDGAVGALTYFVNELRLGEKATPYCFVTAMGSSSDADSLIPADMNDGEILINQWLAEDLDAAAGDAVELTYFVIGPMRRLIEQNSTFSVRQVLPLEGQAVDPNLMPDFPGLADEENCRDWDPGIPIDLDRIRPKDEDYWQQYRGTPRAFVTLPAGRKMWANRFGNLTAVRYPSVDGSEKAITEKLLTAVDPASVGLFFQPVRARGLKAGAEATDFGRLFLGLSMFLIAAAVVLLALLFVFGVESRAEQVGMLLALGLPGKVVRQLLLIEGGLLAVVGAVVGTAAALAYTKAMIYGLNTIWSVAITHSEIHFSAEPTSLITGAVCAAVVSVFAIWLTLRRHLSRPARELLASSLKWQFLTAGRASGGRTPLLISVTTAAAAVLLLVLAPAGPGKSVAVVFFTAGALLLLAGLALLLALLKTAAGTGKNPMTSLRGLGLRNSTRRSGRSLTVAAILASGVFLIVTVAANRKSPLADAAKRDSGTGGFALFTESTIPVLHDLSSESGRESLGLSADRLEGAGIIQLRVCEGDEASCLNLNRAQRPRLLSVRPEQLQSRGAFGFVEFMEGVEPKDRWNLLEANAGDDVVPAIGDYSTIIWSLGKSVGDELEYTDEKGRTFRLRLVAMLKSSILQGSLLIAEQEFVRRFPSVDGYRVLLVDAPRDKIETVSSQLSGRLKDFGLEVTPAAERLARFGEVENTYLSMFQMLGGLGLVLGSIGLGLVVLRNVLERRGELAMLRAVGFSKTALKKMVFYEHFGLMLCGLLCGVAAAMVAVSPALRTPGAKIPYLSLTLTIAGIALSGVVWIWIAAGFALSGRMLAALRNE